MSTTDVVVVGAGPTGLLLACELALGGCGVRVLEQRASAPNITRAFAVHARTLELLDARGLTDDLLPRGMPLRHAADRSAERDGIDRPDILPAVGTSAGVPAAVLVRPDGYVAWADERLPQAAEVSAAVQRWSPART